MDRQQTPSASSQNSKYELQNSVSELFRLLNVHEGKHLSKEAIAENFEKNIGRQSTKPFSKFYSRLAHKQDFVEKYQSIKSKNIHEVDPFVRFLVRVREDKEVNTFLNHYKEGGGGGGRPIKSSSSGRLSSKHNPMDSNNESLNFTPSNSLVNNNRRSMAKHRSSSASSALQSSAAKSCRSRRVLNVPNLDSPTSGDSKISGKDLNDSCGTTVDSMANTSHRGVNSSTGSPASSTATARKVPSYLSKDFCQLDWPQENDCFNTLGTLPVAEQEQLLLRDLLFVLIGIEGRYIRLVKVENDTRYKLLLDPTTDHFLAVATNRILKISSYYSLIISFVESRVYGLVIQALVAAVQQHLYDYNMLICQMEDMLLRNDLFLQKMFFMLLPYFTTFRLLGETSYNLYRNRSVGGAVLTILHEKTKSIQGMDNNALELFLTLTKASCIPYFDILKTWIYYGEIDDPRREFFIEDTHNNANVLTSGAILSTSIPANASSDHTDSDDDYDDDFGKFNDKYWDVRYRINPSKTPAFLKKHEQIIYKTGKYVSIINKVKQLFMKCSKVPPPLPFGATTTTTTGPSSSSESKQPSSSAFFSGTSERNLPSHFADNSFISTASSSSSDNASQLSGQSAFIFTPKPEQIEYSFDESTYLSPIVSAYEEASSQLLHILIHESQLVETFNAVKHYMLLSMGDFIVHFIRFASKDLCKRTDSVVQHRLDSMMGMALGISVCHSDRQYLNDDPHVEFVGKTFLKQIYQIMKPLGSSESGFFNNDPSPSSSYLIRCEDEDDDEDEDINLNRSIISSIIESPALTEVDSKKLTKYINSGKNDQLDGNVASSEKFSSSNNQAKPSNKLFCYESLILKFDVPFPLSLIFTQKSIICYELLFRYVFLCRYAEMELEETWKDNILNIQLKKYNSVYLVNSDESPDTDTETARLLAKAFKSIHKKAFALRYKMIAFVRNFHYFYAFEVVDPFFSQFISQITKKGSSLDSVIECHEKFLEHCFSSCFLSSMEITSIIIKIFTLCIELSHALKDSIDASDQSTMMESSCFFNAEEPKPSNKDSRDGGTQSPFDTQIHDKLNKMFFSNRYYGKSVRTVKEIVDKANSNFDLLVSKLLKKIYSDNCEYHMMYPFVARLDYNDFYRSKIIE